MEKERYMIGDVANLLGMSRDTLRHYEKRGILPSVKGDNGYRYYTKQDINKLISILYQRKMDLGLSDIADLWSHDTSVDKLTNLLENRLEEEEQELRRRRQTIARLKLTHNDCQNILAHMDQVFLGTLPGSYVIEPHVDFQDAADRWFQVAREYPGLDMTYILDEYSWEQNGGAIKIDYQNTRLTLRRELADYVDCDVSDQTCPLIQPTPCVASYCLSATRIPSPDRIQAMVAWAGKEGTPVSHRIFCTFGLQGMNNGQLSCYQQIYLPVS